MKCLIQSCQHPGRDARLGLLCLFFDPKKRPSFEEIKSALEEYFYSNFTLKETLKTLKATTVKKLLILISNVTQVELPKDAPWMKNWNNLTDLVKIGSGRFHSVYKATLNGFTVAGNRVHKINCSVMKPFNIDQFSREVALLGYSHHPSLFMLGTLNPILILLDSLELVVILQSTKNQLLLQSTYLCKH